MEDNKRLCPFCSEKIHPGDQVCIYCGKKIPNVSLNISDLTDKNKNDFKKKSSVLGSRIGIILCCGLIIILAFLITYFFFLKR